MLRISKQADYGLVLLAHIAGDAEPSAPHSAPGLARVAGLPLPTASKILKALTRAGILESRRGAAGGYALARDPGSITLAAVLEALEGPLAVTDCSPSGLGLCRYESACPVRSPLRRLNALLKESLAGLTLGDLLGPRTPSTAGA